MTIFRFKVGHRLTILKIERHWFRCSIYKRPFLSIRFGCFSLIHDWNKIGPLL